MREKAYREEGRPDDLLQELGYETADIKYKQFSVYGAYFFGFFIFCIIGGFVIMWLMSPTGLRGGRMSDYIPKTSAPLAAPLLQSDITARTDIMSLRQKEDATLSSSAVIDQAHGIYRIPIDNAIDDVANMSDSDRAAIGLPPATASVASTSATETQGGPQLHSSAPAMEGSVSSGPATTTDVPSKPLPEMTTNHLVKASASTAKSGATATTKPKGGDGGK